jgi:hypothetical protein
LAYLYVSRRLEIRVARFFLVQHTKRGKIKHLPLQDPQKFTQIGIFGLKMYHLATLLEMGIVGFFDALRGNCSSKFNL